jgi:hypothetical protein
MHVQGSRRVLLTRLNADVLIGVGAKRFVESGVETGDSGQLGEG